MTTLPTTAETIRGTYDALLPMFEKRPRRKIQNNTYATLTDDGRIVIRYHATDIITYHGDDTMTLNSGGWHTSTTADRYHNWLPRLWSVSNHRGVWNVYAPNGERTTCGAGTEWESTYPTVAPAFRFFDGMTVTDTPRHQVVNYTSAPDFLAADNLSGELRGMIRDYVNGYDAETIRELFPDNDDPISRAGDCWACIGILADGSHLVGHLIEQYRMVSLVFNAFTAKRFGDPALVMHMYTRRLDARSVREIRKNIRDYLAAELVPYGVPAVTREELDAVLVEVGVSV